MANDPSYVRLADHMSDAAIADVVGGSGWSISGRDVKKFPDSDDDAAVRFVRGRLVAGILEAAGKAEHDEVQSINRRMAEVAPRPDDNQRPVNLQEGALQEAAKEAGRKLAARRASGEDYVDDDDPDKNPDNDANDNLTGKELNDALKAADLSTSGSVEDKQARLREYRQSHS